MHRTVLLPSFFVVFSFVALCGSGNVARESALQPLLYMVSIPTDGHGEEWIRRVLEPSGRQGDLLLIVYGNGTGACGQKPGGAHYPSGGRLVCLHIPSKTFTSGRNIMIKEAYRLEKQHSAEYMYWILADWDNYLAFNSSDWNGDLEPMDIFESTLLTLRSPVVSPWIHLRRPTPVYKKGHTFSTRILCSALRGRADPTSSPFTSDAFGPLLSTCKPDPHLPGARSPVGVGVNATSSATAPDRHQHGLTLQLNQRLQEQQRRWRHRHHQRQHYGPQAVRLYDESVISSDRTSEAADGVANSTAHGKVEGWASLPSWRRSLGHFRTGPRGHSQPPRRASHHRRHLLQGAATWHHGSRGRLQESVGVADRNATNQIYPSGATQAHDIASTQTHEKASNQTHLKAGCWHGPWAKTDNQTTDGGSGRNSSHLAFSASCHPPVEFALNHAIVYVPVRPLGLGAPGRVPKHRGFPLRVTLGQKVDTAFLAIHRRAVPVLLPYYDVDNVTWWGSGEIWWAGLSCLGGSTLVLRDIIAENTVHSTGYPHGHLPEDLLHRAVKARYGGIVEAGILDVGKVYPPGHVELNYRPVTGVVKALAGDWTRDATFLRCEIILAPFFELFVQGIGA